MKMIKNIHTFSKIKDKKKSFSLFGNSIILFYSKKTENAIHFESIGIQIDQPIQNQSLEGVRKINLSIQLLNNGNKTRLAWNKRIQILEKVM